MWTRAVRSGVAWRQLRCQGLGAGGPLSVSFGAAGTKMAAELTTRQRVFLRSAGRRLTPQANVGKGGLSEAVLAHVDALLSQRELIKVRLLETAADDRRRAAKDLAEKAGAFLVDLAGRVVVLYRPGESLPAEKRLRLPPG